MGSLGSRRAGIRSQGSLGGVAGSRQEAEGGSQHLAVGGAVAACLRLVAARGHQRQEVVGAGSRQEAAEGGSHLMEVADSRRQGEAEEVGVVAERQHQGVGRVVVVPWLKRGKNEKLKNIFRLFSHTQEENASFLGETITIWHHDAIGAAGVA